MLVIPPPNKKKPKKECVKGGGGGVDFTDFPSMQKNPHEILIILSEGT